MRRFDKTKGKRDFGRSSSGRSERRSDRGEFSRGEFSRPRRNSELELTTVICAKCGKSCEIPFKPTSNKPVYCRSCFSQTSSFDSGRESGNFASRGRFNDRSEFKSGSSSEELNKINRKLDKIMQALKIE